MFRKKHIKVDLKSSLVTFAKPKKEAVYEVLKGLDLIERLTWSSLNTIMYFDRDTKEIIMDKDSLMGMIQLVNQWQPPREIRLVDRKEFEDYRNGRKTPRRKEENIAPW